MSAYKSRKIYRIVQGFLKRYRLNRLFDRQKKPWLAVIGDKSLVEYLSPELVRDGWLLMPTVRLVFVDQRFSMVQWSRLRGRWRRSIDGVVWIWGMAQEGKIGDLAPLIRLIPIWMLSVPLYVLQQYDTSDKAPLEIPIHLFPNIQTVEDIRQSLLRFAQRLGESGTVALLANKKATFEAKLSIYIEKRLEAYTTQLDCLMKRLPAGLTLRGLGWLPEHSQCSLLGTQLAGSDSPSLFLSITRLSNQWLAWGMCGLASITMIFMVLSFRDNVAKINQMNAAMTVLNRARDSAEVFPGLVAMQELIRSLSAQNYSPGFMYTGLDQRTVILSRLWQCYGNTVHHWLIRPAHKRIELLLDLLGDWSLEPQDIALDPMDKHVNPGMKTFGIQNNNKEKINRESQHGAILAKNASINSEDPKFSPDGFKCIASLAQCMKGYEILKAYLMLDSVARTKADFLAVQLMTISDIGRLGVAIADMKAVAQFYAAHAAVHPEWRLIANPKKVARVRQMLGNMIEIETPDDVIYRAILQQAAAKYPAQTLTDLLGHSGGDILVASRVLPGVYTRQAWDNVINNAIDKITLDSKQEVAWVLHVAVPDDIKVLKARLVARYFNDYANAWRIFLNGISLKSEKTLGTVFEILRLYADVRSSSLQTLFLVIRHHTQLEVANLSLLYHWLNKVQGWRFFSAEKASTLMSTLSMASPLDPLFSPFYRLLQPEEGDKNKVSLSLAHYFERLMLALVQLQHKLNIPHPDQAVRPLFQTLFTDKTEDALSKAFVYAELLINSLGDGWRPFAEQVFLSPLAMAVKTAIKPTMVDLNTLWRTQIILPWTNELSAYFPFNDSDHEVSILVLERFIHPEQGLIVQFISSQLAGVLDPVGRQWVPRLFTNGLTAEFDPSFLVRINQLRQLAAPLFAHGEARYRFKLMPVPSPNIEETALTVDGCSLHYFNQKQQWVSMSWPGNAQKAGIHFAWRSSRDGVQRVWELEGSWAWIRFLAKAHITQMDKTTYQLEWRLPENNVIRYLLYTDSGDSLFRLLSLRSFRLPTRIFTVEARDAPLPD